MSTRAAATVLIASLLAASSALPGCGFGTAGAVSAASGGDGAGDTPSPMLVAGLDVSSTKLSPARIQFVLTDPDASASGRPVTVALSFTHAATGTVPIGSQYLFDDVDLRLPASLIALATSGTGQLHDVHWDFGSQFATDPLLAAHTDLVSSFQAGFTLRAVVLESGREDSGAFTLGNDPPVVTDPAVTNGDPDGISGLAAFDLTVSDTSGDPVSVTVEFTLADPSSIESWMPATPQGAPLVNIATQVGGVPTAADREFLWNVVTDLGRTRHTVRVRFTPRDGSMEDGLPLPPGATVELAAPILVDNNPNPIVLIDQVIQLSDDHRRGITIPFQVTDPNSDAVSMVFQYRLASEVSFPTLPDVSGQELRALLLDPDFRAAQHILEDFEPELSGLFRAQGAGDASIELIRLTDAVATIASDELVGADLEILRLPGFTLRVDTDWPIGAESLVTPTVVTPIGDGRTALVFDSPTASTWRMRPIRLANGSLASGATATGAGTVAALELATDGRSALVAVQLDASAWSVVQIELASGVVTPFASSAGTGLTGTIRGVVRMGAEVALATVGDGLLRLEHPVSGTDRVTSLLTGLATPNGILREPGEHEAVLFAEQTGSFAGNVGRLRRFDLLTRQLHVVQLTAADASAAGPIPRPESIALVPGTNRLLVLTDRNTSDGAKEVRAVDLGMRTTTLLAEGIPGGASSLVTGDSGLSALVLPASNGILARGGIEQTRAIQSFDEATRTVVVSSGAAGAPFMPVLNAANASRRSWRIRGLNQAFQASPLPRSREFVWDSRQITNNGTAALRATAVDSEIGAPAQTDGGITIHDALDVPEQSFAVSGQFTLGVDAADTNNDGLVDLIATQFLSFSTDAGRILIFEQSRPGGFDQVGDPNTYSIGSNAEVRKPNQVRAVDLDRDGKVEIVVANNAGDFLGIYRQPPGVNGFRTHGPAADFKCGSPGNTGEPNDFVIADLNNDGRLDLASANFAGAPVSVFLQTTSGTFGLGASPSSPNLELENGAASGVREIAAGDFNSDGFIDLATSAAVGIPAASVYLQSPTVPGTFAAPILLEIDDIARYVEAGDFDNDGRTDLAVLDQNVTLFVQNAAGVLHPASSISSNCDGSPVTSESFQVADLDDDGDLDIVVGGLSTLTALYQDRAAGAPFSASSFLPGICLGSGAFSTAQVARDIDGDGDVDLAVAEAQGIQLFLRSSSGTFSPAPSATLLSKLARSSTAGTGMEVADLDGDGDADIVAARTTTAPSRAHVEIQAAPGLFVAGPDFGNFSGDNPVLSIVAVDLDGDRDGNRLQDVAVTSMPSFDRAELNVFTQASAGFFGTASGSASVTIPFLHEILGDEIALAAGDILDLPGTEDDGLAEIVAAIRYPGVVQVYTQTAYTPGGPPVLTLLVELPPAGVGPGQVLLRDIIDLPGTADDGLTDLVVATRNAQAVSIFAQRSPAAFGTESTLLPHVRVGTTGARGVACTDVDGNGLLDLLTTSTTNRAEIWLQTSPGVFGSGGSPSLALGDSTLANACTSIGAADLDRDGLIDVAITHVDDPAFLWFRQTLPGKFVAAPSPSPALAVGPGNFPQCMRLVDLDGDGDNDVVTAKRSGDLIRIWYGGR